MTSPQQVPPAGPPGSTRGGRGQRRSHASRRVATRLLPALVLALALASPAAAQSVNIDLGQGGTFTGQVVKLVLLLTVLSLAPSILVMVTSFVRIVIVLSLLRTAIGLQQSPPNPVLASLALFLTLFIMMPTFETAWRDGVAPLIDEEVEEQVALERAAQPFHAFMRRHVREKDVALFLDIARLEPPEKAEELPWRVLVPAFMISELRRAFEIGFIVFVPFLIIDMVVACLLMAMGMMMLPPVMISLPFKLIFFVLIDGWYLLVGSLVESFATG
ncbi:MAG: flagellar type III secretion system pore protein FliP [Geminicoccaceae bacterium]|nr:flagellar type III secretion system pore protein FliP [Geminicoccaceae bacterium]MCX8101212.1 flagellar type III secretion system pore protein FliP [Geminicoccaceae bacterium]MDW8368953.1 flagellar type III secretion system pore protein FliP [Geminicoccaceae bacterium]